MLKKTRRIIVPVVVTAVVIGMTVISAGQGVKSGYKKTVDAWIGAVKVIYNNHDMTSKVNPIVINGNTYLSLRSVATLFSKSIAWNSSTKTVVITDAEDSTTITQLQNEIIVLKAELAKYEGGGDVDLDDLEDDLNDDYDKYKGAEFEIALSGDEDDIKVKIKTEKKDWNDISSSKQKSYLQDIVDDILDDFDDADIEGTVKDGSKKLEEFEVSSRGKVKIDGGDIDDLEDTLKEKLEDNDFGTLDDIDNDDLEIELDGDEDDLTFYVNIKLDDDNYDDEWKALSNNDIEDFLKDIYDEIEDDNDFGDAEIEGFFYDKDDDDKLYKIYESSGNIKYKKYNY